MGGNSSISDINRQIDQKFNFVNSEVRKIEDEAKKNVNNYSNSVQMVARSEITKGYDSAINDLTKNSTEKNVFQATSVIAVFTNAGLVFYTAEYFGNGPYSLTLTFFPFYIHSAFIYCRL